MKIGAISLGCDKNRVDTEKMLSRLISDGIAITNDQSDADIIIVNTCAFTDDAKKESIDEILKVINSKKPKQKIIVTGCLPQRYGQTIVEGFPEVQGFLGVSDYDSIVETVKQIALGEKICKFCGEEKFYDGRALTTPYHYAYLKIADGCNNHCTYCAIPSIRGRYRSYPIEGLIKEAKQLADDGVKEIILVAQDVTRYGIDIDGVPHLIQLVDELSKLDFEWIRLMYLEPEMVDDVLINYIASNAKVCKYADVPLQHVDDGILKLMNRHTTEQSTYEIIGKLKDKGIAVRSSFIVGFPTENEQSFQRLKAFIKAGNINYAGFFEYSEEEGTPAAKLDGQVNKTTKKKRAKELYACEQKVIAKFNKTCVGKQMKVIYDEIDYDKQMFVGRSEFQAPDVDSVIYFTSERPVEIGSFYDIEITDTLGLDLVGRVIWK